MIPGLNLLAMALTVIQPQGIVLHRFISRVSGGVGKWVSTYAAPEPIATASVQAVSTEKRQVLGLDADKDYVTLFAPAAVRSAARSTAPDRFDWAGSTWECVSATDWLEQDGWTQSVAVRVGGPSA